ncbi:MAG: MEDS domain-containing protein [Vicinamibacterales bacterium]
MTHSATSPHAEHALQLFDAARSRADATARFLADGWDAGDHSVVIARKAHWDLIADHLEKRGYPARSAPPATLRFLDAQSALRRMRRRGIFVRDAGYQISAELVEEATAFGRPLRIYGEVVDILAEEGSFNEACDLEAAWNAALAGRQGRVLCGYAAAHFADPRQAGWLTSICQHHSHVATQPADTLGTWLTSSLGTSRT